MDTHQAGAVRFWRHRTDPRQARAPPWKSWRDLVPSIIMQSAVRIGGTIHPSSDVDFNAGFGLLPAKQLSVICEAVHYWCNQFETNLRMGPVARAEWSATEILPDRERDGVCGIAPGLTAPALQLRHYHTAQGEWAMGIGLALSGGGFRATLFHLGVIRRLAAEGKLSEITRISSVSGGSIVAAHLVANWKEYISSREEFDNAAAELIALTKVDVRGHIQRRLPFLWLSSLVPRQWRKTPTQLLAKYYDKHIFHETYLNNIVGEGRPELLILSTNLSLPGLACFGQKQLQNIPFARSSVEPIETTLNPLAQVVAASSAYPGFFPPIHLSHEDVGAPEGKMGQYFTDAGVFDNLGLFGLKSDASHHLDHIHVSDAGRSFVPQEETEFGIFRTALRAVDILMFRIRQLDLAANIEARKLTLISIADRANIDGASEEAVQSQLQNIRTDLDRFSDLEVAELIRHGYYVTAKALASEQGNSVPQNIPEWDLPATGSKSSQSKSGKELQESSHRRWRLFSVRDYVSWLQACIIASACGALILLREPITETVDGVVAGIRAQRVISFQPSDWQEPSVPVETVENLTQPKNSGFEIISDDRVWDLRGLYASDSAGGNRVVRGSAVLTRVSQLVRTNAAATHYAYLFQTAADKFYARSPQAEETVKLLQSKKKTQSGSNVSLTSYELQLDVSRKELNKEFQLQAQAKTIDAPWDRNNTWLGMRFSDPVPSATIRIIFPKALPFKEPVFLKYPNDSGGVARSSDGIVLQRSEEKELLWRVDKPEPGMTYRIQWNWD
jgi:predicted acylesterase/phospholipase RssA